MQVGHASSDGSRREVPAGPAAVALAATPEALFILEGIPTFQPNRARTHVLERVDPSALTVINDVRTRGLTTDLAVDGDSIWVVATNGVLTTYDAGSLTVRDERQLEGGGAARVVVSREALWVLNSTVSDDGATVLLLHRLDRASLGDEQIITIPDAISDADLALGDRVWVGAGRADASGQGKLYAFGLDGSAYDPVTIARPVALSAGARWLWVASGDGSVEAVSVNLEGRLAPLTVGQGATDLAVVGTVVWIASDQLVILAEP